MHDDTLCLPIRRASPDGFDSLSVPVHRASTITFPHSRLTSEARMPS